MTIKGHLLVLGAKSDIAKAIADKYAVNGYDLYLAARNVEELTQFSKDIEIRTGRTVKLYELDILNYSSHQEFYSQLENKPVGVVSAIGYLGNQEQAQIEFSEALKIVNTNFTGQVSILNIIANDFEQRKSGFIVGISSVAGDRGRKSNYVYGSAKASLTTYLSGLRNRLYDSQVQVMTVKPGFVETKMTEGMDLPTKLTAQPEAVAKEVFASQQKGKDVIYTKWIWYWIMLIIKLIPESIFKRTSI